MVVCISRPQMAGSAWLNRSGGLNTLLKKSLPVATFFNRLSTLRLVWLGVFTVYVQSAAEGFSFQFEIVEIRRFGGEA